MELDEELKNFKNDLTNHAKACMKRVEYCETEEASKQGLVLPFIALLGYNVFDVNEVKPEHSADFSDKYKNRVDYAILKNKDPVIAIECKKYGALEKTDRGQLKSYFNACQTVKLGILTDGVTYELYADSDSPNIMDDIPFLSFNFKDFSENKIDEEHVKGIYGFKKTEFNPDNVGAEAKKKMIFSSLIDFLDMQYKSPSDDFIKYLLTSIEGWNQRMTTKVIEENRDTVKTAFSYFVDKKILAKMGLEEKNLVKIEEKKNEEIKPEAQIPSDIITTEREVKSYKYAKQRLAFLVDTDELYQGIEHIHMRDFKTSFIVYYKAERAGRLFNMIEQANGKMVFSFPNLDKDIVTDKFSDIDEALLSIYKEVFKKVK